MYVYAIPMRTRFRGIQLREGVIFEIDGIWREWSPFVEYDDAQAATWLSAALEINQAQPVRTEVPVNVTVPVINPVDAKQLVAQSGCHTAKIKVADPKSQLADDIARVAAVREALPDGQIRVDANGAWSVAQAVEALTQMAKFGLQYAEQPCRSVEELAELKNELAERAIEVPIAADESIRKADDPLRVAKLGVADIAVVKLQPLGGWRRLAEIAEQLAPMPIVVSSALETSIGIAAGVCAAATLPNLSLACGLNTVRLLAGDVVEKPLIAENGVLKVTEPPKPSIELLQRYAANPQRTSWWLERFERCKTLMQQVRLNSSHD